ncbi:toll-like receptor 3 [Leucoraja erinacea]|uniref:toll-like receptor 3 n=1 Tax=Leucoraja erinaceus TaxID=7782 RepID=UPI002453C96C|nr:toll-like receptor 3 [Leucoraja erinacea]
MCFQALALWMGLAVSCFSTIACESQCKIKELTADCSHLKLSAVPPDLPVNLTEINLSHNQLKRLPSSVLARYTRLRILRVGYNVIPKIDGSLCQALPFLDVLALEHNQLSTLPARCFSTCRNLTELYLQYNRIKLIAADVFGGLQGLQILDLSHNQLVSARIGVDLQLPKLQSLLLSANKIVQLKPNDFAILRNTTLYQLDLSFNKLTQFEPKCFSSIGSLRIVVLNNVALQPNITKQLCDALSGTDITTLFLRNTYLKLEANTFSGLAKTKLAFLDLSNNRLTRLPGKAFQWLPHLEYLNLEDNAIGHIANETFTGLDNLKSLNLQKSLKAQGMSDKVHSSIEDYSFQGLKKLVSLNLEHNTIAGIKEHTFSGLTSLQYLSLYNCQVDFKTISNETLVSLAESPLVILNLTRTKISSLKAGAFSSFNKLKKLDLGLNSISQILTGEEFQGLSSIEEIYLSYNYKLTLTSSSFIHVPSIRALMLSKSRVATLSLQPSPFRPLRNLTVLDLSNNNLANVDRDVFLGLVRLQVLKLQHNNLARLWKSSNPGGPVLYLSGLADLRMLDMQSSGLDEVPPRAFQGLVKLETLDLSLNNINFLPDHVFDDIESLKSLHLRKNLVTSVSRDVFGQVFRNLTALYMGSNPFDCTCASIAWFVTWVNSTNSSIPGMDTQYICNTPLSYHNSSVASFDTSPCKDAVPFKGAFIISSSVILVFLVSVLLLQFQGWRLEFYWNVSVNQMFGFKEIDRPDAHFAFDAYIVHAKRDVEWVNDYLMPLETYEQFKFRFCLEERDSEAGVSELESIVANINRSRKIIFVMTGELLTDPWCRRFKVHHAMQQVIQQSRDAIVLIFLQDIPDYKLNQMLCLRRGMFKSRCILNWPAQDDRIPAFYQKFKVALGSSNKVQ